MFVVLKGNQEETEAISGGENKKYKKTSNTFKYLSPIGLGFALRFPLKRSPPLEGPKRKMVLSTNMEPDWALEWVQWQRGQDG